jgi:hypothetical protein
MCQECCCGAGKSSTSHHAAEHVLGLEMAGLRQTFGILFVVKMYCVIVLLVVLPSSVVSGLQASPYSMEAVVFWDTS